MPKEDSYDPLKHKLFFKNALEVFQSIPLPEIEENPPEPTIYPKIPQFPTSPRVPRNPVISMRQHE
jgi:hypothetical protein